MKERGIAGFHSRAMFQYFFYRERLAKLKVVFCGTKIRPFSGWQRQAKGKQGLMAPTRDRLAKSRALPDPCFFIVRPYD